MEVLEPRPREDENFEFMYEIEDVRLDRSAEQIEQNVAVCGPEDFIKVLIPDRYGSVWCYEEATGKLLGL